MQRCTSCHAPLEDERVPCTYCGALGPAAQAQRREQRAAEEADWQRRDLLELEREHAEYARAVASMESVATHSLLWSTAGALLCCLPVGPLLGLLAARRARRLASELGLLAPARATWGLGLGAAGLLLTTGLWGGAGWMLKLDLARKAQLESVVEAAAEAESLEPATACALTELELLETDFDGYSVLDDFLCDGRPEIQGEQAVLHGLRFRNGSTTVDFVACLKRGRRWSVDALRLGDSCEGDRTTSSAASPPK
jgi:hypothetical protein